MDEEERTTTQIADGFHHYTLSIHRKLWMGVYSSFNIAPLPYLKIAIFRSSKDLGSGTESKFSERHQAGRNCQYPEEHNYILTNWKYTLKNKYAATQDDHRGWEQGTLSRKMDCNEEQNSLYIFLRMRNNWLDSTMGPMDFNGSIIHQ